MVFKRPDGRAYADDELPLSRSLRLGERVSAEEVLFERKDGHKIPALVTAVPVLNREGAITAAIAVMQDMTSMEQVERLRSEFLGMVSHELKTPLTAIKGGAATYLGSRRPLDDLEVRELFGIINEQADRLRDMVDNLLDMTRIEAGTLAVHAEPLDLAVALQEATDTFLQAGGRQDVELRIASPLPPVQAERRRIVQVVSSLLSNASKFSPETEPIVVSATLEGQWARVEVRDRGRGIDPNQMPHLFKKFSRLRQESHGPLTGAGLGLADSQRHRGGPWRPHLGRQCAR
ncbi:MAG: PAS domain-containing protein [Chloroflexi bacterium]|nr:PAS domain-containing protein [Chloroflexota bacterium]